MHDNDSNNDNHNVKHITSSFVWRSQRLEGRAAIEFAREHDVELCKFADPVDDARVGLSVGEAEDIAAEDPSLIFIDILEGVPLQGAAATAHAWGDDA